MARNTWLPIVAVLLTILVGGCAEEASPPAGNPLAADSAFKPNTDAVAGGLSKKQVDLIVEKCRDNAGIPGGNEDCTDVLQLRLSPCQPTDRWCLTGDLTSGVDGTIQIIDQRGGKPTCDSRLCGRIKVPSTVVEELVRGQTVSVTPSPTDTPSPSPSDTASVSVSPTVTPPSSPTSDAASPTDAATP